MSYWEDHDLRRCLRQVVKAYESGDEDALFDAKGLTF